MPFRLLLAGILAMVLIPTASVAAPVTRTVADRFEITLGWASEPAILGDTNGVLLRITDNGQPVSAAETTLVADVTFMEAVRTLALTESTTEPGTYTGTFIPMQPGDYSFTLTGSIDGVEINETFTIADGIVPVSPRTDYEFPNAANGFAPLELAVPAAATVLIGLAIVGKRRFTT